MTTKQGAKQAESSGGQGAQERIASLTKYVIQTLGRPIDLLSVKVHHLWENRYRINVFTGQDLVSAVIAYSYFVMTDIDGTVISCSPKITKIAAPQLGA